MSVLSGQSIRAYGLIDPCFENTTFLGMTYGLSVAGYDVRVEFDEDGLISGRTLLPGEHLLASTLERFNMPNNVIGIVHDKSSWARQGMCVQNTVIEPGWRGYLTLELTNHSQNALVLKRGMAIAQVVFHWLDMPAERPYDGKYQDQGRGPIKPR